MATLNISLPDPLKEFVEEQVADGVSPSTSDYIRDLVRDDQKRKARDKVEALLLEGLDSGASTPMTAQDWQTIRGEVQMRVAEKR